MEPSKGDEASQDDAAPSNPAPSSSEANQPTSPRDGKADDTLRLKPGDALYDAIHGEDGALKERARPNTDTAIIPGAGRMSLTASGKHAAVPKEMVGATRDTLQDKSKEDLIDMLIKMEGKAASSSPANTAPITPADTPPRGFVIPEDQTYIRMPRGQKATVGEPASGWRIVLLLLDETAPPLGLQIDAETTVGSAAGDAIPDLDLTGFGAKAKGVSRIHARLRPETHSLILVDNDSSNGTFWNKIRIPAKTDQPLKDGDVITFGRVNFLLKVALPPQTIGTKKLV